MGLFHFPKVLKRERKLRNFHPEGLHYCLWLFGVYPEFQNKGIGKQLIKHALEKYDQEKRPIFLETSVKQNLNLYNRFGFNIIATINVGYPMYLMIREVEVL